MNNVFDEIKNPEDIKEKYDLKGSSYKRHCTVTELRKNKTRKDNDFLRLGNYIKLNDVDKSKILK